MNIYKALGSKTCLFHIRLSVGKGYYLVSDTSNNPHLMKGSNKGNSNRRLFFIYPEPGKDNEYRMQLQKYLPSKYVVANGNDNPFKPWAEKSNSDDQLFRFVKTSPPAKIPEGTPSGVVWYLIERVASNKVLTWGGVIDKYAHAMTTAGKAKDRSKVFFEAVGNIEAELSSESNEVTPKFPDQTPVFVARDVIPASLVNLDDLPDHRFSTKWAQIETSPYYYLELERFWKKADNPVEVVAGGRETRKVTTIENYSREDYTAIELTIAHTFKTELELGYDAGKAGGAYGSLKFSYEYSNQRRTNQSTTTTTSRGEERSAEKVFEFESDKGQKEIHQRYQLINRYTLKNSAKNPIQTWEYAEPNENHWDTKVV